MSAALLMEEEVFVLLDACVVINLYASRRMPDMLQAFPCAFGIVDLVAAEAQSVWRGGVGDDARERERIELAPLVDGGVLGVVPEANDEELATFIGFTLQLDDGEAMTAALALHRGYVVATDDRVAVRIIGVRTRVVSSVELLKAWADAVQLSPVQITELLRDVRQRGRYTPRRAHPLRGWWDAHYEP